MSSIVSSTSVRSNSVITWDVVYEVLDNELILDKIFNHLPDSCDLKICRLVSSKWNRLSVKHMEKNNWKNKKNLQLESDEKLQDFINTFVSSLTPNSLIFSCFSFHGDLNRTLLKKLFITFPQQMKSVFFSFRLKDLEQLEDILESQDTSLIELEMCPFVENYKKSSTVKVPYRKLCLSNLVYLTLTQNNYKYANDVHDISEDKKDRIHIELLTWILSKIPVDTNNEKLIPLKIILRKCHTLKPTFNSLQKLGFIKNLKMIEIESFKPEELDIFINAGVELKCLYLSPMPYYDDPDSNHRMPTSAAYALLQNQINSLEILKYEAAIFKFPSVMRVLKILYLRHHDDESLGDDDVQIPILYHQYFPNLQVLILNLVESSHKTSSEFLLQFLSPQEPCLSLRSLSINYRYLRGKIIKNISSIFPQLNGLTIKNPYKNKMTDIEEIQLYSELWNSSFAETLEELCIDLDSMKTYTEREIEYMRTSVCWFKRSNPPISYHKLNTIFSGVMKNGIHSFRNNDLNESKLKNLKKLKLVSSVPQQNPLTDFAAYYIFGNMEKLKVLHLDEKLRKFTPGALKYLKNKNKTSAGTSNSSLVYRIILENNLEMYCETDPDNSTFTNDISNLLC